MRTINVHPTIENMSHAPRWRWFLITLFGREETVKDALTGIHCVIIHYRGQCYFARTHQDITKFSF